MHPHPIALQNRMCYTVRKTSCTCNHMFVCTTIEKGLIRRNGKSSAQDNQDRPAAASCIAARPYAASPVIQSPNISPICANFHIISFSHVNIRSIRTYLRHNNPPTRMFFYVSSMEKFECFCLVINFKLCIWSAPLYV